MSTKHENISPQSAKRLRGGELILKGYDDDDIADIADVSISAVKKWRKKLNEHNDDLLCLVRKKGSGRIPCLNEEQKQELKDIILKGAVAAGYSSERWTSKIAADFIKKKFGVELKPRAVRYLLSALGLSPQMPVVVSHKHDEKKVIEWATRTWKRIKKKQRNSTYP